MALRLSDPDAAPSRGRVSRSPIDAETAGRRRLWWTMAEQRRAAFQRLFNSRDIVKRAAAFTKPSGTGRNAARIALERAFRGLATLERVEIEGRAPMALWAVLKPRKHVIVGWKHRDLTEGEKQDAITVDYFLVARLPNGALTSTGLWSCEVREHALGRAMQRDRRANPDHIIMELHNALLRVPISWISAHPEDDLLVKAGPGVFVCEIVPAFDSDELDKPCMLFCVHTWLDRDMLWPEQEDAAERLAEADGEPTLARWFLNPARIASPSADQATA